MVAESAASVVKVLVFDVPPKIAVPTGSACVCTPTDTANIKAKAVSAGKRDTNLNTELMLKRSTLDPELQYLEAHVLIH